MSKLSYKVSYYVFYVCIAIILVVLALFFGVGYDHLNEAGLNEPVNTPALMYLMYFMFFVCVAVTVIAAIVQILAALRDNPANTVKSLLGFVGLVVLLIVTYTLGSDTPVLLGGSGSYDDPIMLKVTDMFIYSTYVLLIIASVAALFNLIGVFKK